MIFRFNCLKFFLQSVLNQWTVDNLIKPLNAINLKTSLAKFNIMKNTFLTFLLSGFFCTYMIAQGNSSTMNYSNKMNVISFNKYLPNPKVDFGHYALDINDDFYCIQLMDKVNGEQQHYMIENCFDKSEIKSEADVGYNIVRRSGVLSLEKNTNNTGDFSFEKNDDFVRFLKSKGIELNNDLYYFKLFLGDISESYIQNIIDLGFKPTITELGRLTWHDASINYVKTMNELFPDFTLDDISMLSAHEVSMEYLQSFIALGVYEMDLHSIKKAKMHELTPKMIKKQQKKGYNFSDLNSYIRILKYY